MTPIFYAISKKKSFRGYFLCNEYYPNGLNVSTYRVCSEKGMNVVKINKNGEVDAIFKSKKEAADAMNDKRLRCPYPYINKMVIGDHTWQVVPCVKIFNNGNYNIKCA